MSLELKRRLGLSSSKRANKPFDKGKGDVSLDIASDPVDLKGHLIPAVLTRGV